ncbi:MAG: HAMP domain-containing protein [gamma proteobacterium symbiont of Taylorina sp.]|nr:HAMP domain-containing protein [gamma proteobacterium symbiont of Taylorina sp.]
MTIKHKLLGGGIILSVMLVGLMIVSTLSFGTLGNGFIDIIKKSEIGVSNSTTTKSNISKVNQDLEKISKKMSKVADEISHTNQNMKLLERKIKQISANLGEFNKNTEEMIADIPESDLLYELQDMTDSMGDIEEIMRREALIGLSETVQKLVEFTDNISGEVTNIKKLSTSLNKVETLSTEVVSANQSINELSGDFKEKIVVSRNLIISLLIIVGVIAMGFSIMLAFSISRRLDESVNALNDIAEGEGDLTHRLNSSSSDEISALARAFNLFSSKIQHMVVQVTDSSGIISEAVTKVTHVNDLTKESVDEQAEVKNKVQQSIQNMTGSIKEVANNAANAAKAAKQANEQAEQGGIVVAANLKSIKDLALEIVNAEETIQSLEEKSDNIGTILDTIRGIAEQTNLLALNAAIEAARAGESGRGFAVVADEVRNLAHKTQDATNEIQDMIAALQEMAQKSVSAMTNGRSGAESSVEHASKVGEALSSILTTINSIYEMNTGIAHSTDQQLSSTIEINSNIENISKTTDTTIEGVSFTEAALIDLVGEITRLQELVAHFKIE